MSVSLVYPPVSKRTRQRAEIIEWASWPFLLAAYACPLINIVLGGKAWSVVVLWSLWIVWTFTLSPELVEVNRISQFVKFVADAVVLMVLVELLLSPGWAVGVVPIVCFASLIIVGVLFFTDYERQRQNMLPMLVLTVLSLVFSVAGLIVWHEHLQWPLIVMAALAFALIGICIRVLGADFLRELRKRFHMR